MGLHLARFFPLSVTPQHTTRSHGEQPALAHGEDTRIRPHRHASSCGGTPPGVLVRSHPQRCCGVTLPATASPPWHGSARAEHIADHIPRHGLGEHLLDLSELAVHLAHLARGSYLLVCGPVGHLIRRNWRWRFGKNYAEEMFSKTTVCSGSERLVSERWCDTLRDFVLCSALGVGQ